MKRELRHSTFNVQRSTFDVQSVAERGLVRRPVRRSLGKDGSFSEGGLVRRSLGEGGFTLIEVMVVLVIIMILVGIVIGTAKYAQTKAATSRAQSEIAIMETALEHYKNDNGIYPKSAGPTRLDAKNNSASLYNALTTPKVYLTFKPNQIATVGAITYIVDPFGSPYNYYSTQPLAADQENKTSFDLWSYGPDGRSSIATEQADDLTNWKQ